MSPESLALSLLVAALLGGCMAKSDTTMAPADDPLVAFPDAEIRGRPDADVEPPPDPRDGGVVVVADASDGGPPVESDSGVYTRPTAPVLEPIATAAAGRVRFKGGAVLRADLAGALGLGLAEVASELGTIDAFTIHNIALRGVDPYGAGIFEPNDQTPVTAPAVVDRVVLSACRTRVDRDLERPASAVVFDAAVGADGFFEDRAAMGAMVDHLYRRMLGRDPETHERAAVLQFYSLFLADREPRGARGWAILSCFMVGTSLEMLFY